MSQLASAWTKLASELNSKLTPVQKTAPTQEEYEKMADLLIAFALSSSRSWDVKGSTEDGRATLVLHKTDWQPADLKGDWTTVGRIIRAKIPASTGFSFQENPWEPIIAFQWVPPAATGGSGLSQ